MILTAHQPAYLSWLGLLSKIASADVCVILDTVPMSGKDSENFVNRNRISTANGPQWLTVPVHRSNGEAIKDVKIAHEHGWARKHRRAIEQAYRKAPYFERYAPELFAIIENRDNGSIADLGLLTTAWLMKQFDIRTQIVIASYVHATGEKDAHLLSLCQELGADEFIFGANGKDYANVPMFERAGVKVRFQEFKNPDDTVYSAVHYLFTRGPDRGLL